MKKSILTISFLFISVCALFAQKSINNYKYVLVPKQFEFQNGEDSYQVNSLTKFLFERTGFTVFFTDESYPEDLAKDRCLTLKAKVKIVPSFLVTKMVIELVDCMNNVVFVTKEAKTKEKDFKKAYHSVIRNAFEDIESLHYSYEPTQESTEVKEVVQTVEEPKQIEKIVEEKDEVIVFKETLGKVEEKEEVIVFNETLGKDEVTKPIKVKKEIKAVSKKNEKIVKMNFSIDIVGNYLFDNWGESKISKKDNSYAVIGGDENFQFATIYNTSKLNIYIIKWAAFKQPQLLVVTKDGNLKVDSKNGTKIYKRIH